MRWAVVALITLLIAACSSGDDETPTPSVSDQSAAHTASVGAPATQTRTPAPTAPTGGAERPLDVPEAGGNVPLTPGSYRTARFQPTAHFSVGDGWSAATDSARFVDLFRDDPASNCVCLISPDGVIDPATGDNAALPGTGSVDDIIAWLTGNQDLKTSNPSSLQISNIAARQLDVEVRTGIVPVDQVDYLTMGDQRFSVTAGERQHLVVLEVQDKPVVIAQRSPSAEYNSYFGYVEQIVGTLTFAN